MADLLRLMVENGMVPMSMPPEVQQSLPTPEGQEMVRQLLQAQPAQAPAPQTMSRNSPVQPESMQMGGADIASRVLSQTPAGMVAPEAPGSVPKGDGTFLQRLMQNLADQGADQTFAKMGNEQFNSPLLRFLGGLGQGSVQQARVSGNREFAGAVSSAKSAQELQALLPLARNDKQRQMVNDSLKQLQEIAKGEREDAKLGLDAKKFDLEAQKLEKELEGGADPEKLFKNTQGLRKEFADLSKEYSKQVAAHGRIRASAEDPSAAGDLALIFNYMKLLDPGSTVREGEFANAENSAGVEESVRQTYNKLISGERLTPVIRDDFVDRAERLFGAATEQHETRADQYRGLATKSGLDPEQVVLDLSLGMNKPVQADVDLGAASSSKEIDGTTYYKVGDQWYSK